MPVGSTEPKYFEHRINAFISLVGDKQIAAYGIADLVKFADELRFLPQRHTVDPEWRGMDLKEAIERNRSNAASEGSEEPISYTTVKVNYIGKIKTAIRWLCANHKVKYPFEHDIALIPKDLPTPTVRRALDDARINALFRECVVGANSKRPADVWLPLLAYLTGARLGELVALQPHNVKRYNGIYVADLTKRISDQGGVRNRQVKNRESLRQLALHNKLLEVGFIGWVEKQREAGHEYLFPDLHQASRPSHAASKRFQRLFSSLDMGGDYVFHSLRHTFKDWMRSKGVPERTIALQAGHSLDGIALRYGSRNLRADELKLLAELPLPEGIDFGVFEGVAERLRPQVAILKAPEFRKVRPASPDAGGARRDQAEPSRVRSVSGRSYDVRALRTGMGLSQREFAEKFGIPCGTLRDWEQGRTKPGRAARSRLSAIAESVDGHSSLIAQDSGSGLEA